MLGEWWAWRGGDRGGRRVRISGRDCAGVFRVYEGMDSVGFEAVLCRCCLAVVMVARECGQGSRGGVGVVGDGGAFGDAQRGKPTRYDVLVGFLRPRCISVSTPCIPSSTYLLYWISTCLAALLHAVVCLLPSPLRTS